MQKKALLFLLLATCCAWFPVNAQPPTAQLGMQDMIRLNQVYRMAAYLSFDVDITYADSTTPGTFTEEMSGLYQIHDGRFRYLLDSTEIVQGNNYNLVVYHDDQLIAISKPQAYPDLLNSANLFDSTYARLYITTVTVNNLSDSVRVLKVSFKAAQPYSKYEITYDPRTYLLRGLKYYIHDRAVDQVNGSSGTSVVTMKYSNYSTNVIGENNFRESKFIYKDGDSFYAQAPYSNFRIVVYSQ